MVGRPSNAIGSIEAQHPSVPVTSIDAPTTILTVAPASLADSSAVVDVIAEAFLNDPTWSWAFPDPAARRRWWEFCMDGALRYPWTLKTDGFETVSVWIPPSGTEFSHEAEQQLPGLLKELVGSRASEVGQGISSELSKQGTGRGDAQCKKCGRKKVVCEGNFGDIDIFTGGLDGFTSRTALAGHRSGMAAASRTDIALLH